MDKVTRELSDELYDFWQVLRSRNAFDTEGYLDLNTFRGYGGRMNVLRSFVCEGVITDEGKSRFKLMPDIEVIPPRVVHAKDYQEPGNNVAGDGDDKEVEEDSKPEVKVSRRAQKAADMEKSLPTLLETLERIENLSPLQLELLGACQKHTTWNYGTTFCRIRVSLVYKQDPEFTSARVSQLLERLGFPHKAPNYMLPAYLRGVNIHQAECD